MPLASGGLMIINCPRTVGTVCFSFVFCFLARATQGLPQLSILLQPYVYHTPILNEGSLVSLLLNLKCAWSKVYQLIASTNLI